MTSDAVFPSQQHRFQYNEPMPVESCTQSLCDLALQFGEDDEEGGMVWFLRTRHGYNDDSHQHCLHSSSVEDLQ